MRFKRIPNKAVVAVGCALFILGPLIAMAPQSARNGVYTEAQSKRGETLYSEECARCHGPSLGGGDASPELAGEEFEAHWNHRTAADLFGFMQATMPTDSPGHLSRQQYADLCAYILNVNGFPAGKAELSREIGDLNAIAIEWKN